MRGGGREGGEGGREGREGGRGVACASTVGGKIKGSIYMYTYMRFRNVNSKSWDNLGGVA